MTNAFGLSRAIPEDVKRRVRQRDGFGCVVCGHALIEYDHFDPEFAKARSHDPDGIILLCVMCHAKKTRKILSREAIASACLNPAAKRAGFSHDHLSLSQKFPTVSIGVIRAVDTRCLLRIFGDEVLRIDDPEAEGAPYRISADFRDRYGKIDLQIRDNEWRSLTTNWDVEYRSERLVVRSEVRSIDLRIRFDSSEELVVEQLKFSHRGVQVLCREGSETQILFPTGVRFSTGGTTIIGAETAIDVSEHGIAVGVNATAMQVQTARIGPSSLPVRADADILPFPKPKA